MEASAVFEVLTYAIAPVFCFRGRRGFGAEREIKKCDDTGERKKTRGANTYIIVNHGPLSTYRYMSWTARAPLCR